MSNNAAQIVATFGTLPRAEQHAVLVELLRTAEELPDSLLGDEHLVTLADALFQQLDAEESNDTEAR